MADWITLTKIWSAYAVIIVVLTILAAIVYVVGKIAQRASVTMSEARESPGAK